jgi:hypothetical protein
VTKTFADKLPSLQSDLLSSQQVDIENYNVSANRLRVPAKSEGKSTGKHKNLLTLMNGFFHMFEKAQRNKF